MGLELAFNMFTSVLLWNIMRIEGINKVVACFVEGTGQRVNEGEMKLCSECFLPSWVLNNLNALPILNLKII